MEWAKEDVQLAFRIFLRLLENGQIIDERELFYAYQRSEVRQILEEVIEAEADVKIFALGDHLYLSPGLDNRTFGYTNEELREKMKLRTNQELYLAYFTILCLLAKFYNSDDQTLASRQFVPLEELEETITGHMRRIQETPPEQVEEVSADLQLNLANSAEIWLDLPPFDDTVKNLRSARNNRISFLLRVLAFLEEEDLVQILQEHEVRLLPKMEHLVVRYYFHSQRKDELLALLATDGAFTQRLGREQHATH
ncbi:MAG: DUF6063 family protein [Limnochordia bacterium]|jgi:hypothetical protein|nr:DUF6063 family protein [Limnochordia bacterium]